jgi:hypothetical protein
MAKPVTHTVWNRRLLAKFRPGKYDFDLYKGFFIEKNGPNSPDSEGK